MKIQYFSDIHLERVDYQMVHTDADVVVIAGDLHVGTRGLDWIKKNIKDKPVIYVPGNHEFYRCVLEELKKELKEQSKGTNIHFLQDESIIIDGVKFIGATLWTDFNLYKNQPLALFLANQIMNDYYFMRKHGEKLVSSADILKEHENSLHFIKSEIDPSLANVIITHHLPTEAAIHEKYKGDRHNVYYASELSELILNNECVKYWIHGHSHSTNQIKIGKCKVCINARGYADIGHNKDFVPDKTVTVHSYRAPRRTRRA